jgi:tungstate transport system ATP-binding protein
VAAALTVAPKLSARGLAVRRSGRAVVDVPQLDVPAGCVYAIIGPNGAGKSTLLLRLALLERPDAGEVLFEGKPSRGRELALRRRMAVAFQEPLLLDRGVAANVETGLAMRGVPRAERHARATHWLERFGVGELADRSSRTLSGGEAQRVSLARAFALEPEVLFLDEPFSALDQPTRTALIDDLAAALAATRVTTLLVTHDHDEAARLADTVAVMMHGRIKQSGPPAEIFSAPVDEETAAFVGLETMFPARVTGSAGGLLVLEAPGGGTVEAVGVASIASALVCLRPEDVSLSAPGADVAGSVRNRLPGRVRRITAAGAVARVEVDCGFDVVARVTRRSIEEMALDAGSEVVVSFKATAVHLIPK